MRKPKVEVKPALSLPPDSDPDGADDEPVIQSNTTAQVSLLGYHEFTENKRKVTQMRIHVDKFRSQMQAIKDAGISVISLADFIAWKKGEKVIPDPSVVITIDDGWKSTYTIAYPIFKEFGYPFSMFLYKAYVDGGGRALSSSQIREMLDSGLGEIGCHSWSHPLSGRKFRNEGRGKLSDDAYDAYLNRELVESKSFLEERFGKRITCFAFPGGIFNDAILAKGKKAGYEMMITVSPRRVTWDMPLLKIDRYIIYGNDDRNFRYSTQFRSSSTSEKKLVVGEGDGDGEEGAVIAVFPESGSEIPDRRPILTVDLSNLEEIDAESLSMTMSGFGAVPVKFDAERKVAWYRPSRKLRSRHYNVSLRLQRKGEPKPDMVSWAFKIDQKAAYLVFGARGSAPENEEEVATEP